MSYYYIINLITFNCSVSEWTEEKDRQMKVKMFPNSQSTKEVEKDQCG